MRFVLLRRLKREGVLPSVVNAAPDVRLPPWSAPCALKAGTILYQLGLRRRFSRVPLARRPRADELLGSGDDRSCGRLIVKCSVPFREVWSRAARVQLLQVLCERTGLSAA